MPPVSPSHETVVALVPRSCLAEALAAIHSAGLGRWTSVVDPARGDAEGRLQRLGIVCSSEFPRTDADSVLVIVPAPGRIERTEELLRHHGALAIEHHGRLPAREHSWFASIFGGADSSETPAG